MTSTSTQLEVIEDFGQDAGLGSGGLSIDEQRLPFLLILHHTSPQCLKGSQDFIPGAEAGMLFNSVTKEIYEAEERGVEFLSCWREKVFTAWVPRDSGGGFRGVYQPNDPVVQHALQENIRKKGTRLGRFGKIPFTDPTRGNEYQELTEQWNMGIVYAPDLTIESAERAIFSFSSTRIKSFTTWAQRADQITYVVSSGQRQKPPTWAQAWRLTTTMKADNRGSWYVPVINTAQESARLSAVTQLNPLYDLGREFYTLWSSNKVQVDYGAAQEGETVTEDDLAF